MNPNKRFEDWSFQIAIAWPTNNNSDDEVDYYLKEGGGN